MLKGKIKIQRQMKAVIDCGNACACLTAPIIFPQVGIQVKKLYCDIDGSFPNHHPDPTEDHNLSELIKEVKSGGYDFGVAFDGDADRVVAIDETGSIIRSDILMALFLPEVIRNAEDPIIFDVKCSQALSDMIIYYGGKPVMWKTGHSLIKDKMKELDVCFAGEMSGHIFFKHRYYGFDDAVYAGGRLLEILSEQDKSLSELLSDVPKLIATPEIRRDCPDDIKFQLVEKIITNFQENPHESNIKVINTDGLRLEWPDGWGLVRCSNTQPILVLRFKAQTQERLEAIEKFFEDKIEEAHSQLSA